jgi:hypothetical protein
MHGVLKLELASPHPRTSRDRRSSEQHRILAKTLDDEYAIRVLFVILSLSNLSTSFTFSTQALANGTVKNTGRKNVTRTLK